MGFVALTGANGFLGWHLRAALMEDRTETRAFRVGEDFDLNEAKTAINGASRFIHIAGVNRASDDDVLAGNIAFAEQAALAIRAVALPPATIVFANSTQVGNGSIYGEAKSRASDILAAAAAEVGSEFIDVSLPNLFGEHGRPAYNSVTATFCDLIARGIMPSVEHDKELTLLHAQNAVDVLRGFASVEHIAALSAVDTVSGLLRRLTGIAETYRSGDIPDVSDEFGRDLFNTYRSFDFSQRTSIPLTRHADARGSFFEIIRTHGGPGQSSFSTTVPGISRGDHFHRRKIERFTVLSGTARISLRRVLTNERVDIDISGDQPVAVDMPTMWSHNITNMGDELLYTSFWTNDIFDPSNPDTIAEAVTL